MKKARFFSSLIAFIVLFSTAAHADEGMWTLYNLPQAAYQQMVAEGFKLPFDQLYKDKNAIKNNVVNFSGYCSGVVVSPDGLVFTNHHCGFDAIRSHSTVEHDYMLNGFCAQSFDEELPNDGMFVAFMRDQQDITPRVEALDIHSQTLARQEHILDSLTDLLSDSVRAIDSTLYVEIDAFYEGNAYYATTYQSYPDLRLVFALPKSMGKFGGETDNWMWPRQTCDFSVFRIYVDPVTGGPAPYSKNNVPYHPESWAPVSLQGYQDGDFSMTVGYPGSTERYLSSYGIKQMRDCENDPRQQVRGVKQQVMKRHMDADEAVRIKYDSKYANSANYWKNSIGMNKCIDSINIIGQKQRYEALIRVYQDSTGYLKGVLDLDSLGRLYASQADDMRALTFYAESFNSTSELTMRGRKYMSSAYPLGNSEKKQKKWYVTIDDNSDTYDTNLDKEVLWTLMENYEKQVDAKYLPDFYNTIKTDFGGSYKDYVNYVWDNTVLMRSGKKIYKHKKATLKDPGIKLAKSLAKMGTELFKKVKVNDSIISEQERHLCAAKIRMEQDMPHYSDANFTMRLSYGQVGGYDIGGYNSGYFTEANSLIDKINKGNVIEDYFAEPEFKDILANYKNGKGELCFLTNNDITGGNSGSPMFDGQGRLIGLAFDGNWDSLSSDIFFDSKLARCIGVDIRYVLYMMDKWGHADRLLKEINAK